MATAAALSQAMLPTMIRGEVGRSAISLIMGQAVTPTMIGVETGRMDQTVGILMAAVGVMGAAMEAAVNNRSVVCAQVIHVLSAKSS